MATRKQIINKIIEAKNWGHYWAIKSLYTPNLATKNNTLDLDNKRHYLLVPTPDEIQKIAQSKGWTNIPDELDKIIINCKSEDLVELPINGTKPGGMYTFKNFLGLFNGEVDKQNHLTTYRRLKTIDKKFYTNDTDYYILRFDRGNQYLTNRYIIPKDQFDKGTQAIRRNGLLSDTLQNKSLWEDIELPTRIKTCSLEPARMNGEVSLPKDEGYFSESKYK